MAKILVTLDPKYKVWGVPPKEENRPVLCGVHIDPKGLAVVTNGFILAVTPCQIDIVEPKRFKFEGAIVPSQFFKDVVSFKLPVLTIDTEAQTVTGFTKAHGEVTVGLIQGNFPNWRQLIPKKSDMGAKPTFAFDPALLVKARDAVTSSTPARILTHKHSFAAIMPGEDGAFALIMPIQAAEVETAHIFKHRPKESKYPVAKAA